MRSLTGYADALASRIGADGVATGLDTANRSVTSCNSSQTQAQPRYYAHTDIPLAAGQIISSSDRFCHNTEDSAVRHWFPQGVTGPSDADDDHLWGTKRALVVAWHYSATEVGDVQVAAQPGDRKFLWVSTPLTEAWPHDSVYKGHGYACVLPRIGAGDESEYFAFA